MWRRETADRTGWITLDCSQHQRMSKLKILCNAARTQSSRVLGDDRYHSCHGGARGGWAAGLGVACHHQFPRADPPLCDQAPPTRASSTVHANQNYFPLRGTFDHDSTTSTRVSVVAISRRSSYSRTTCRALQFVRSCPTGVLQPQCETRQTHRHIPTCHKTNAFPVLSSA